MSLKVRTSKSSSLRFREKRRGNRMNSRVPVRLEWDSDEKRARAEGHTRVVNSYGCMIVLSEDIPVEQRVALINLAAGTDNVAVIVWKGSPRPEGGWEYGVELVDPDLDFWGLEL